MSSTSNEQEEIREFEKIMRTLPTVLDSLPDDHADLVGGYRLIAIWCIRFNQFEKAIEFLELLVKRQEEVTANLEIASLFQNIGNIARNHKQNELSIKAHYNAIDIYNSNTVEDNRAHIAENLMHIVGNYNELDQYENALAVHEKILEIKKSLFSSKHIEIAYQYKNIGRTYEYSCNFKEAIEAYDKAIEITSACEPLDYELISILQIFIGDSYFESGNFKKALNYYQSSLYYIQKKQNSSLLDIAEVFCDIAETFGVLGEFENLIEYLNKAILVYEELNHTLDCSLLIGNLKSIIGTVYMEYLKNEDQDNCFKKAIDYYREFLEIYQTFPYEFDVDRYFNLYQRRESSKDYVLRLVKLTTNPGYYDMLWRTHGHLSQAFDEINQYKDALFHGLISLKIKNEQLDPNHPSILASHTKVANYYAELGDTTSCLFHIEIEIGRAHV